MVVDNNIIGVDDEDLVPINFEILSEKNEVIKSSILLDQHEEKQFTELITSIEDVFAYDYTELGCCDIVLHTVRAIACLGCRPGMSFWRVFWGELGSCAHGPRSA